MCGPGADDSEPARQQRERERGDRANAAYIVLTDDELSLRYKCTMHAINASSRLVSSLTLFRIVLFGILTKER